MIRDEQVLSNATITANGASGVINNALDGHTIWVLDVRNGAGTGTTPTLTFAVMVSVDGVNFIQAGPALASLVGAGIQRTVYAVNSAQGPIIEPFFKVTWTISGTTPSFPAVYADLIGL